MGSCAHPFCFCVCVSRHVLTLVVLLLFEITGCIEGTKQLNIEPIEFLVVLLL